MINSRDSREKDSGGNAEDKAELYVTRKGKKLRKGFTTGTAAAAAAGAAARALLTGEKCSSIKIDTPAGIRLDIEIENILLQDDRAKAVVRKDAGDDQDVTDGLEIAARVELDDCDEIKIKGGEGVGKVTKAGLAVEPGRAAINPVPRKMIRESVSRFLPEGRGALIVIEVPEGAQAASQTLNPDLGIKGGISIIGTTGIVEPMSESAYKDSLVLAIDQARAAGIENMVFVFGNYGKNMAESLGYPSERIIRMSNFVGFMLEQAAARGVKEILLIGHIGKLVKVAAGIFNTHSRVADGRLETIAAYTALSGGSRELIQEILNANTAAETVAMIKQQNLDEVFDLLAERAACRAQEYLKGNLKVSSLVFSLKDRENVILGSYRWKE